MRLTFEQNAQILGKEVFLHRRFVAGTFVAVTALATIAGLFWPRDYQSTAMIMVNNKRLIDPLLKGAAYQPDVGRQRAHIAEDLIKSRAILLPAMATAGFFSANPSAQAKTAMLRSVRAQTTVMELGKNLIQVSYKNRDPQRAYHLTAAMVGQFIGQDRTSALGQAQQAYHFLSSEVASYRKRLRTEAGEIHALKAHTLDADPSFARYERRHARNLRATYDKTMIEIREDQARMHALEKQLTGASRSNSIVAQESLDRSRLINDESELSRLRVYYRKTYPGVQVLQGEVGRLRKRLAALNAKEKRLHPAAQSFLVSVGHGGFYRKLEHQLDRTQAQVATLDAQARESHRLLMMQMAALKDEQGASPVAALLRDYRVDEGALNGLLKRREEAQVSLNLDRQRRQLSFRVYEPANVPAEPIGPPFSLFVMGGAILGLILPIGLLHGRTQMDARVRAETVIPDTLSLPLIAVVPHLYAPSESLAARRNVHWLGILVIGVVFVVVSILMSGKNL
ncbi:MAG: hypothetical protein M0Z76_02265 [Gammaproteobacteria bacterium]|nr:hypothetical protein [Gammaproteobacteria bacterium]